MVTALRKTALSVAVLSLGIAMSATAQTSPAPSSAAGTASSTSGNATGSAKLSHGDRKFMDEAAQGGMAEVQMGQLATQKAQSDQVKQFGQKMVDDHTKANDQLKQIASSKGVTLPTELDSKSKREMDRLSKLSGAQFDREYMKHMVSDHKKDVKDFKKEAKSAKDSDVKNFASTTEPVLEQHLQMAESTDAAVRNEGKSNTAKTSANTVAPGTTSASHMTGNSAAYGASGSPGTNPVNTARSGARSGT